MSKIGLIKKDEPLLYEIRDYAGNVDMDSANQKSWAKLKELLKPLSDKFEIDKVIARVSKKIFRVFNKIC